MINWDVEMLRSSQTDKKKHQNNELARTLNESEFLWKLFKLSLVVLIFLKAGNFAYFDYQGSFKSLTDFNAFFIAGKLALLGRLPEAYHFDQMRLAEIEFTRSDDFLPWTYPLPFDLIVAPFALLPIAPAYLIFISASLLAYWVVLQRLRPKNTRILVLLLTPTLLLNIACGQNGMLTGALIGLFCLGYLKGKKWAALPLGVMIIKPHVAAGIGLYLILKREWSILGRSTLTALSLILIASAIFGSGLWSDFFDSVRESSTFLREGQYPLHRMSSAFATAFTLSGHFEWARLFQALSILTAIVILSWLVAKKTTARNSLGMACLLSVFYSPYFYDYDLPLVGLGIALLSPSLKTYLTSCQRGLAVVALLLAEGGWLLQAPLTLGQSSEEAGQTLSAVPSLAYLFLLLLTGLSLRAIQLGIESAPLKNSSEI